MIQDIGNHVYVNHFEPHEATPESYLLHYVGDTMLCRLDDGKIALPRLADLASTPSLRYLFSIDGTGFFLILDEMGLEDRDVRRIMGITQEAIRSTRYRILQNGKK